MALSIYDFTKGLDMTALVNGTFADLNNLVDLAAPKSDDASNGKGMIIWTVDTALDTPNVPNASVTTKWKRYLWLRLRHVSSIDQTPAIYFWNDLFHLDATYLRWQDVTAEIDIVSGVAASALANANTAITNAANALSVANAANASAASANSKATSAETNATNAVALVTAAQTDATTALANAATAQATANTAKTTADTATTNLATLDASYTAFKAAYTIIESAATVLTGSGLVVTLTPGYRPKHVQWVLVVNTAHGSFNANDEIDVNCIHGNSGNPYIGFEASTTLTTISLYLSVTTIYTARGALDYTKCSVKCYYAKQ